MTAPSACVQNATRKSTWTTHSATPAPTTVARPTGLSVTDHPVALARCGICHESYDLGQTIQRGEWKWWPNGEAAYWAHTLGDRHQKVVKLRMANTISVLHVVQEGWHKMRQVSKDARDPALHALRRLMK